MSTPLYERTIAYDYGDSERNDLMRKVWQPTPWMVDVFSGECDSDRSRMMIDWCHDQFGDECWPLHGKPGAWQRGNATVAGWTWFGFATEAQMQAFMAAWPNPEPRA